MSSFKITARHKKRNTVHEVWCMDDYFGRHNYGYVIDGLNGVALREDDFYEQYSPEDKPQPPGGAE